MQDAGTYVLQWQNQEDQTEFLPSISSHKAQLMYFYETLPSAHYRYLHNIRTELLYCITYFTYI